MAYRSEEAERGCGWRDSEGGIYVVGNGATVGGTIPCFCRFVMLEQPIPFPKEAKNPGRGFIYVDGDAILNGQPAEKWAISPERADLLKLTWSLWGLDYDERRGHGICADDEESAQIEATLQQLAWVEDTSVESWLTYTKVLLKAVKALRVEHGDCPLIPAIIESRRFLWYGPLRDDPRQTLARLWRLVTELSWATSLPVRVLATVSAVMEAIGAGADVPLLEKFYVESKEES